jgi:hypothetical protein
MISNILIIVEFLILTFFIVNHFKYLPNYQNFNFDAHTKENTTYLTMIIMLHI